MAIIVPTINLITSNAQGLEEKRVNATILFDSTNLGHRAYESNPIEILAGVSVVWTNDDRVSHSVTANPEFGSLLIKKFDEFGSRLDKMRIKNPQSDRSVKFFRYDRMALGDAITERESGTPRLVTYLKFNSMFETDTSIKSALEPAAEFVRNLAFAPESDLESLLSSLNYIQQELEKRTMIHISP